MNTRPVVLALLLALTAAPAFAQPPGSQNTMETHPTMPDASATQIDPAIARSLAEYDASRALAPLRKAADDAALHDGEAPPDPATGLSMARMRVATWIAILSRFKRDIDPDFDPDHPPSMNIVPPGEHGDQYAPGVSPQDVKDPEMRRQYIVAIEKNRERLQNFGATVKLKEAHRQVVESAASSIADARHTLGLPLAEITAMLDRADITRADRKALLAASG